MAVLREFRNAGVGRRLVRDGLSALRGNGHAIVFVHVRFRS